ncbi:MAG: trehalose-phosphatase, partial [Nitrococcus sp.]|nr:trehalose-phosphatase [Nitrococcus sp.]
MAIAGRQPLFSRIELDAVIFELDDAVNDAPRSVRRLIEALRERGYRTAVVSSRRIGAAILSTAGTELPFDVRVDGAETGRLGLHGKPNPDVLLHTARLLQAPPQRCAIIADALAAIEAARAGGFGLVLAATQSSEREVYLAHGARGVFADLAEVAAATLGCEPRRAATLPSALAALPRILQAGQEGLLMLLDYDGTLTPIVERPELAVLADETRTMLCDLVALMPVAVVSGRELAMLRRLVDVPGLVYVGDHGFDITDVAGEGHQLEAMKDYLPILDAVEQRLRAGLAGVAGALLERKRSSVAVHFRLVAEADISQVQTQIDDILSAHPQLKTTPGKKVVEIQPGLDWDKGRAVEWLLPRIDAGGRRHPVYIGDDRTDENAFRAVCARGTGILVRDDDHPTVAHYALEDPGEVRLFLHQLIRSL